MVTIWHKQCIMLLDLVSLHNLWIITWTYKLFIEKEERQINFGNKNNWLVCIVQSSRHAHFYKIEEFAIEISNQQISFYYPIINSNWLILVNQRITFMILMIKIKILTPWQRLEVLLNIYLQFCGKLM
jgi:hypothetical protein